MIRVAMTLPKELLNEFDKFLKEKGYNSRNKGFQDAMEEYIQK